MVNCRGSILELKEKKAVVMTDTCDFVYIKRQPGMLLGQQIEFKKSAVSGSNMQHLKYIALIASIFILSLCSILYFQLFCQNAVFAYIDVDINPSIEFAINKKTKVLEIRPLNDDSKSLIKDLNLINLPVKQAIAEIITISQQKGYIKSDEENTVLVSAAIENGSKAINSDETVLDSILDEIDTSTFNSEAGNIKTEIIKVSPEFRNSAVENNMSMGRYSLYSEISKDDKEITVEKAKTAGVSDMIEKAKNNNPDKIEEKKVSLKKSNAGNNKSVKPNNNKSKNTFNNVNTSNGKSLNKNSNLSKNKISKKNNNSNKNKNFKTVNTRSKMPGLPSRSKYVSKTISDNAKCNYQKKPAYCEEKKLNKDKYNDKNSKK